MCLFRRKENVVEREENYNLKGKDLSLNRYLQKRRKKKHISML